MSENKIKEVVKLLNVEIGEEFFVYNNAGEFAGKYKFDDKNLWSIGVAKNYIANGLIGYLLTGAYIIKKLWKPKKHERYYSFRSREGCIIVEWYEWDNDFFDILNYRNGFCYKTREEAEANKSKAEKYFNNDRIVDWEKTND